MRCAQDVMSGSRTNVPSGPGPDVHYRRRTRAARPHGRRVTVTTTAGSGVPPGTSGADAPVVIRTRAELAVARHEMTGRVGVVMTMGALHEGHAALIREARAACDAVVVTIFLNPLQFGPNEDLARYPRTFDADLAICTREGV